MTTIENYNLIFKCLSGSHAYGLNLETSDKDYRGVFSVDPLRYTDLQPPPEQINNDKQDDVYYSVKRFFDLLRNSNPNILELLWMPDDCVETTSPQWNIIKENRTKFITKQAYKSVCGYAIAQIKKARGQKKKISLNQEHLEAIDELRLALERGQTTIDLIRENVSLECAEELERTGYNTAHDLYNLPEIELDKKFDCLRKPVKEDFCYILLYDNNYRSNFPGRPININDYKKIENKNFDLKLYHVAALEQTHNTYRLYFYGKESKGVFRGDDTLVTCESIPKDHERERFCGLLIYNKDAYEKAIRDWNSYWTWMRERNRNRFIASDGKQSSYDCKNMMHCVRLLLSGENILQTGEPIVRFDGVLKDWLMDIRLGKCDYQKILDFAELQITTLDELHEKSKLPESINFKMLSNIYTEIIYYG